MGDAVVLQKTPVINQFIQVILKYGVFILIYHVESSDILVDGQYGVILDI